MLTQHLCSDMDVVTGEGVARFSDKMHVARFAMTVLESKYIR